MMNNTITPVSVVLRSSYSRERSVCSWGIKIIRSHNLVILPRSQRHRRDECFPVRRHPQFVLFAAPK